MTRVLATIAAVAVVGLMAAGTAGCGGAGASPELALPPPKVPPGLVPDALGDEFRFTEDEEARARFAALGEDALVADGRLWQLRDGGGRLVGTLQVSTLKPKIDLTDSDERDDVVDTILPIGRQVIDVDGITMYVTESNDKAVYLWFGGYFYQVLQLKGSSLDPEAVIGDLVDFQTGTDAWEPLPRTDDDEEEFFG